MSAATTRPRLRRRLTLPISLATLVLMTGWLWRLGRGRLATPSLGRPQMWAGWIDDVGAPTATFAIVRLLCLAAIGYLVLCGLLGIIAERTRRPAVRHLADLICLPPVRRLVHHAIGLGFGVGALGVVAGPVTLAGASVAGAAPVALAAATGSGPMAATMTMSAVPPLGAGTGTLAGAVGVSPAAAPVMRAVEPPLMTLRASGTSAPATAAASGPPPPTMTQRAAEPEALPPAPVPFSEAVPPSATPSEAAAPTHYVIVAGDHFWRIAERAVGDTLGREPDEAEVDAYWRRLVTVNTDRLSDPSNPDLLFSGQTIELPAL